VQDPQDLLVTTIAEAGVAAATTNAVVDETEVADMEINEITEDDMVGDGIDGIEAVVVVMAVDMVEEMGMDEDMAMVIVAMRMIPCSWMAALMAPYRLHRKKRTVWDVRS
jgi:hypothetical protein